MQDFQESLSHFFRAAAAICDEVLEFRPDLVMGLMHSASLPLYAGMELWKQTQDVPFPPTVKVNLGREKLSRHDEMEDRPGFAGTFIGDYEGLEGKAFFLACVVHPRSGTDVLNKVHCSREGVQNAPKTKFQRRVQGEGRTGDHQRNEERSRNLSRA